MTGPETILSAMMRKGEGGRAQSFFSSQITAWKVVECLMLGRTFHAIITIFTSITSITSLTNKWKINGMDAE